VQNATCKHITNHLDTHHKTGVDFLALNTDAQHLSTTLTENRLQIGTNLTSGLGCGANPDAGRLAAEESKEEITELLGDAHMVFVTAGMGGGTGTGAAPVVAEVCYNLGILTVGVVTKPFRFEGTHRMRLANEGIGRLKEVVDTLIMIPNQNLFHLANDDTSFMDSFAMADNVLLAGVRSITDLMTTPGLINLDFADVQSVMHGMGNAMLGTGVASKNDLKDQEERAILAAEQALANPLLGENMDIGTAKGMLVNITGGKDMTLFEVDRAAQCITERVIDEHANIIFGSAYDESLDGSIRVSVVATGIDEKAAGQE
jgi:cell division protein FtsZ